MSWQDLYQKKLVSLDDAAKAIESNDIMSFAPGASTPFDLIGAICKRKDELENTTLLGSLVFIPFESFKKEYIGHIRNHSFFFGPAERAYYDQGNIDVASYQFSQTGWMQEHIVHADALLVEVSPPDENGNMSYGPHGTFSASSTSKRVKKVLVQVNRNTPYVYGTEESFINVKDVTLICEKDHELFELPTAPITETDRAIAGHIVSYIEDGSTIQIGIGGLGNAIGFFLEHHKDLGVHTEMLVDSMITLAEKGVITGSKKTLHPGEMSVTFGIGSKKLYRFMHKNKVLKTYPIMHIADPFIIGQNDNFVSINNALSCDLTGQVCSESIGFRQYSGTGGQLDFVRGAALSKGGKSFIALESTVTKKDGTVASRITSALAPGSVVTTPRTDVHYIVTEYGIADLKCRSIRERVKAMIGIAHPMFRDQLEKEAKEHRMI